jgi:hypothetical protein
LFERTILTSGLVSLLALGAVACGGDEASFDSDDDSSSTSTSSSASGGSGQGGGSTSSGTGASTSSASGTGGGMTGCTGAAECDDNSACTSDDCVSGFCSNVPVDTDDGDACTADSCDPVMGIQNVAIDPDDNDVCTTDSCDAVTGVANVAVDPNDNNACTVDSCDPVMGIQNVAVDPNDNDVCTIDSCDPVLGVQNQASITLFSEDFASNSQGWTLGQEWQIGTATASTGGTFGADPANDHSTSSDNMLAGVVIGGNAATVVHGYRYLMSPTINAAASSGHVVLSYWRWLNSDYTPYMHNVVDVYDGSQWHTLWQSGALPQVEDSPPAGGGWVHYSYDVTNYASANFRVRFGFSIVQTGVYSVGSWNVDDVEVLNLPQPADDDPCTVDTCEPSQGAVYTSITMNDSNACTNDACDSIRAIHHDTVNPNDNNACTLDSCNPNQGVINAPITCDDNNACTADSCSTSFGCQVGPEIPQPHDKCLTGGANTPLTAGCSDTCISDVCAVDPYCCTTDWNAQCASEVYSVCGSKSCGASAGTCPHALCDVGPSSTPFTAGCDANFGNCASAICAVDAWCCTNDWDSVCVGQVATVCNLNCD